MTKKEWVALETVLKLAQMFIADQISRDPHLRDPEFVELFGVMSATEVIEKMLNEENEDER